MSKDPCLSVMFVLTGRIRDRPLTSLKFRFTHRDRVTGTTIKCRDSVNQPDGSDLQSKFVNLIVKYDVYRLYIDGELSRRVSVSVFHSHLCSCSLSTSR